MKQIDTYRIRSNDPMESNASGMDRNELMSGQSGTGIFLRGCLLDDQFEVGQKILLLLTDDSPYEEMLHIYLLSRDLKPLDELHLGKPYSPGILKDIRVAAEDQISFSFFGEDTWRLRVLEKPKRMKLDLLSSDVEIRWSRMWSKRFLELTRIRP